MAGRSFFRADAPLWRTVSAVAEAMAVSFLWLVCSLPVVTAGAASAALYVAALRCVRPMEPGAAGVFWRSFCTNLKPGLPVTVLLLTLGLGGVWCGWVTAQMAAAGSRAGYALCWAFAVAGLFLLGWAGYVFPTLGRFSHPAGQLLRLCAALALAHLPVTVLLGALLALSASVLLRAWVLLPFLPAVTAILASFLLEPVYRAHGGADAP